jgi:hypothetical protein
LSIVRELRRHTEAVFRVDANCAWTAEQTIKNAPELKALGRADRAAVALQDWRGAKRALRGIRAPDHGG